MLAADVAGYSRLMGADELGTLEALKAVRLQIVDPAIAGHKGRIVKTTGDGLLVEFASAVDAVTCAMAVQSKMAEREAGGPEITLRIGINVGDIIIDGDDIFGDGVNVAARVESECVPGGVYLSDDAFRQVRGKTAFAFDDLGEKPLKNIDRPVRLYAVRSALPPATASAKPLAEYTKLLPLPDKPSIAVLPFQNMSGDPEQEYFADGMVEDIITALSRVKWFFVIARNTTFTYKGRAVDIKHVGRELGVRYVLEGSVRKAGQRVRITGQLIEAETGHHIWADRFEREYTNVFELQDEVTSAVASAIEPTINLREIERSKKKPTSDLTAYDCFLRAQPFLRELDAPSYARAEGFLRQAVAIDPEYSSALAYLADCIGRQSIFGARPFREGVLEAERIAQQAVQADPEDGTALAVASWVLSVLVGKHAQSLEYGERALRLQPNSALVCVNSAYGYLFRGEFDAARHNFERALHINPLDPRNYFIVQGLGMVAFFERDFAKALSLLTRSIELGPARVTWRYKAAALAHLGRTDEAREAVSVLRSFTPVQTLKEIADRATHAHPWMRELYIGGLEKAGYE
ncbi:adenylate/guanylate cyclase domain-containing protein [Bradyrhizobium oropedii]|uniref:adenylate/guanylate cyclase domain-containing protein n=1 Tax=Bradyrhizobium oropedii TaxID=1571201 RepID=UPI0030844D89